MSDDRVGLFLTGLGIVMSSLLLYRSLAQGNNAFALLAAGCIALLLWDADK